MTLRLTLGKAAHVNLTTDTVIANLPPDGLRSIIRSLLVSSPDWTPTFLSQARKYLKRTAFTSLGTLFENVTASARPTQNFFKTQNRVRCLLGSGLGFECLALLCNLVDQTSDLYIDEASPDGQQLMELLAAVDGDMVQTLTVVQKELAAQGVSREMEAGEAQMLEQFSQSLLRCSNRFQSKGYEFVFERGLTALCALIPVNTNDRKNGSSGADVRNESHDTARAVRRPIETFQLGQLTAPRIFCGLWQLSSPAWGSASQSKMMKSFSKYLSSGFSAFDMADHYGDAELIFGGFRSSLSDPSSIIGATKYCVFEPVNITDEVVHANVSERLRRLKSDKIDLLQFHWQNYSDSQYLDALKILQRDNRILELGLCNFDSHHLQVTLENGIRVASNQVQFSLIDSRPIWKIGNICEEHNIKLLTYGTLCGGFLANKWLNHDEPELFKDDVTPSQRKYLEMIKIWGSWSLFQELLGILSTIASKHSVTISNVAVRWVLDFPYVGAVIVGARMGVSEHADENLASYGWNLDTDDKAAVDRVLAKSRAIELFNAMGDCGSEYR